jgi:membrane fusion protein
MNREPNSPPSSLFRTEIFEADNQAVYEENSLVSPPSWSFLIAVTFLITPLSIFLVSNIEFNRRETVSGVLRPDQGDSVILAPRNGLVQNVYVKEGQFVKAGKLLVTFKDASVSREGRPRIEEIEAIRAIERKGIEERILSIQLGHDAEIREIEMRKNALSREIEDQVHLLSLAQAQRKLKVDQLAPAQLLYERGYLALPELQRRKEVVILQDSEIVRLRSRSSQLKSERNALHSVGDARRSSNRDRILQLQASKQTIKNNQEIERVDSSWSVVSPRDGIVSQMNITKTASVVQGENILVVVPESSNLHAEIYLPSAAVGFVEVGQPVRIMFDAFPFYRHGASLGKLEWISLSTDTNVRSGNSERSLGPIYRAKVRLNSQVKIIDGVSRPLRSGMTLTGDIILESQKVKDLLLRPINSAISRSAGAE